jgi:hypothetical protein
MRPLPSRGKLREYFTNEINDFPSGSFNWKTDPLNEPLHDRLIVAHDHSSFQHFLGLHLDISFSICKRQLGLRHHFRPNVFLELADVEYWVN